MKKPSKNIQLLYRNVYVALDMQNIHDKFINLSSNLIMGADIWEEEISAGYSNTPLIPMSVLFILFATSNLPNRRGVNILANLYSTAAVSGGGNSPSSSRFKLAPIVDCKKKCQSSTRFLILPTTFMPRD